MTLMRLVETVSVGAPLVLDLVVPGATLTIILPVKLRPGLFRKIVVVIVPRLRRFSIHVGPWLKGKMAVGAGLGTVIPRKRAVGLLPIVCQMIEIAQFARGRAPAVRGCSPRFEENRPL